jgi:outer membrane protein OmpA-like peptidoglycan-associated protein
MIKMKVLVGCFMAGSILIFGGCKSMNKTQKGAVIGTAGGAAAGAVVGKVAGNTALGAIIGAAVGGVTGTVIGHRMDKQAEEIKKANANAKVERVGEGIVVEFNDKILFGYDRYDLSGTAMTGLDKVVEVLRKYPDTNIEVQGHTDNKGTVKYNQSLSERRATSVSNYLSQQNIVASRLTSKGFGEVTPKYSNDNEEGQTQNRRVDFLITANDKMKMDARREAENSTGSK